MSNKTGLGIVLIVCTVVAIGFVVLLVAALLLFA